MTHPEVEVRFDFTLDHLERLARIATRRAFGTSVALDLEERHAIAFHAVVVALLEATDPPSSAALIHAGGHAIIQAQEAEQAYLGYNQRDVWQGSMASSRFQKYWSPVAGPRPEDVVDPIAVSQILPHLSDLERHALTLLALLGNYDEAAAAAGVSYKTYHAQVRRARTSFFQLWHEGETPARPWRLGHGAGLRQT